MGGPYSVLLTGLEASAGSFIAGHFHQSGHAVFTAKDIEEAKEKLKAHAIGSIYLQASSDARGVDELREAAKHFAPVPIVLICRQPREGLVLEGWHAGASDVIFPPL